MITESDFCVEYYRFGSPGFLQTLEDHYYTYNKKRHQGLYSKETLDVEFSRGRFQLGMINVWFKNNLARTFLMTNYNNWCLIGRSITNYDVVRANSTYLFRNEVAAVVTDNRLDGVMISVNPSRYLNACFTVRQKPIYNNAEPYLNFLTKKNFEIQSMFVAERKLYLFYYVPQYVAYYSTTGAVPDFLEEYDPTE